jgi:mono/diheme cytochrome c family protein
MASRRQPPKPTPKPKPKPRQRQAPPPPPPPGLRDKLVGGLRDLAQSAKGLAGVFIGIVIIGGAIWLGARQGHEQGNAGFDNPASAQAPSQAPPFTSDQQEAKNLSDKDAFAHTCGTCHTLRAAGVKADIGPDLDHPARPLTFTRVRDQIRTGSIDGSMPSNLLIGKDADRVARYVARVAR